MKTSTPKILLSLLSVLLTFGFIAPRSLAASCQDADGDGAITLTTSSAQTLLPKDFNPNGNYSVAQWQNFFDTYKAGAAKTQDADCDNLGFKQGAEPSRCDATLIDPASGIYDSSKVPSVSGSSVRPGAYDIPDNGIDEDCDGSDAKFSATATGPGVTKDLGSLFQRAMGLLRWVVVTVSVIIMIWGGLQYATAAGDEQKTSKARKAILGAIIGLIIGLLAPAVINYVSSFLL
ncbi:putative metal-binding motif-containing protein [Candidatus Peregrinibacteria bacterium]|nr:putative metal-binding motif-containing protein [Candidatus Peregrinibacteria bacterium]